MEAKQESPRVSPVGPAPLPPKVAEKMENMYAVFAEADIKSSWPTLEEALEIAEDAAERFKQPMLIFKLVGKERKW